MTARICAVLPAKASSSVISIVAQVRPTLAPAGGAAAPATHHLAKDVFENVGEAAAAKAATETGPRATAAILERGMAEAIRQPASVGPSGTHRPR
jgi:hypothetical protein